LQQNATQGHYHHAIDENFKETYEPPIGDRLPIQQKSTLALFFPYLFSEGNKIMTLLRDADVA
jgi:hypothetical protein